MEVFKSNNKKSEQSKSNPMQASEYYYYQSFGKALTGLEKALELHNGRIENVGTKDILENSTINSDEFYNVFSNPQSLLNDVYEEIHDIFSDTEKLLPDMNSKELLTNVFTRLRKNCPMVRVLRLIKDHSVWRDNLKGLMPRLATDWPPADSPAWEYLYANFCCQFAIILEKWETSDFADDRIGDCIRLAEMWLSADSMLGDNFDTLLDDWEQS